MATAMATAEGRLNRLSLNSVEVFPPHPPPYRPRSYEELLPSLANAAMNYYNSKHHKQFELVMPLCTQSVRAWSGFGGSYHLSFIGRRKGSSPFKLFFAELFHSDDVKYCGIVEPGNPFYKLGCGQCHPDGVIYHHVGKYKHGGYRGYKSPPPQKLRPLEESAKNSLRKLFTFQRKKEVLDSEDDAELRMRVNHYARLSLNWFNDMHNTDLELLEPLAAVRFGAEVPWYMMEADRWVHLVFTARNKDPTCTDASPTFFFSELCLNLVCVTNCVPVPPGDYGSGTETAIGTGSESETENETGIGTETESPCIVCRNHCNIFHPEGYGNYYYAGRSGGIFADALVKDRSWRKRVELLPNVDASGKAMWQSSSTEVFDDE